MKSLRDEALRSVLGLFVASALLVSAAGAAGAMEDITPPSELGILTLEESVAAALDNRPDVRRAEVERLQRDKEARATRGAYGPALTVEGRVMVWDDAFDASMGSLDVPASAPPGADQAPESGFDGWTAQQFQNLGAVLDQFDDFASVRMRDQVTWGATLRLTQPLTPLFRIYHGHQARLAQLEQAGTHRETVRADVSMQVAAAYYGALQAAAYVTVADSAIELLQSHVRRARDMHAQELISKGHVLEVEVTLAQAEQQRILAVTGHRIALAHLAMQMGLDRAETVTPRAESPDVLPPAVTDELEDAVQRGLSQRSELRELKAGAQAAEHAAEAAEWAMVPDLALVAQYDHQGGVGPFMQENAIWGGLMLSWKAFEWGQTYYAMEAAEHQAEAVTLMRRRLDQMIRMDVTAKYHQMRASERQHAVARSTVEQATEALRIQRDRFAHGLATSTEVLDAQSNLTRAQASVINAYYAHRLARAELRRAQGLSIVE